MNSLFLDAKDFNLELTPNSEREGGISRILSDKIEEILELSLDNDFNSARIKMSELTNIYGLSEKDFLKYMNEAINKNKYKEMKELIEILAKYDYRIITGSNPDIQLTALLAEISNLRKTE